MAADTSAFLVVACEASMPELWGAMRVLRQELAVPRIHWRADERYADGRHFRLEIPVALLANPRLASQQVVAVLHTLGLVVTP